MKEGKKMLKGIPVSEGIALAKAYHYEKQVLSVKEDLTSQSDVSVQMALFHDALLKAKIELTEIYESLLPEDEDKAKIFLAHQELLEDEEIQDEIQMAIEEEHRYADAAIEQVYTSFAQILAQVEDPLIAGRAADLMDVKQRLIRICQNRQIESLSNLKEDVILVANDLLPSDTATMDREHIKGIVTQIGGYNSHSAILARSFGIPAVLGVQDALSLIPNEAEILLNAMAGEVMVDPDDQDKILFSSMLASFAKRNEEREHYRLKPCLLADGAKVEIGLNIGQTDFEYEDGLFDFVGLFRTEFLYMEKDHLPSEEEQFQAYKEVVERAKGHMVTLRTLDIGGDKTLPYMQLPKEENPFLGKRALRLCFAEEELFLTQLRAALRASAFGPLQLMFPMVGSLEDIDKAKEYVERAKEQLRKMGQPFWEKIPLGIMIEIPSIALMADLAASKVDFASVGTNDLTQYMCAADRMNETVSEYYQNDSVAMWRILKFVFESFAAKGKPVSVCGEMAGDPKLAAMLVQLGARKLSMSASCIAAVKETLAGKNV